MNTKSTVAVVAVCVAKALVFFSLIALVFWSPSAKAQGGEFLNISLSGSYAKSKSKFSSNYRRSLGLELGLPLTSYFQVSLGHNLIQDRTIYNDEYRSLAKERGYNLEGPIVQEANIQDYSANGELGLNLGHVRPGIFGGALRRKVCQEDPLQDSGCETQDLTWNAGVSLQVLITYALRLKASYRISPSVKTGDSARSFDELTSVGLTWGL
jgi:hypothetical protein